MLLTLPGLAPAESVDRREIGPLVLENIPASDPADEARFAAYNNTRGAFLEGWDYAGTGLFISTRFGETANLHHVAMAGGARTQLTFLSEPLRGAEPRPVPGLRELILSIDEGGAENYQLFRLDAAGRLTRLTDGTSRHSAATWAEDGSAFAYTSNARNGRDSDIYVASASAPDEGKLVLEGWPGLWPTGFSPDGQSLLLQEYRSVSDRRLHLLDLATGTRQPLLGSDEAPAAIGQASFTPDGRFIYFTSDEGAEFSQLRRLELATGTVTVITPDLNWGVEGLTISRDGRWLAYLINADGLSDLYVRDLASGVTRRIEGLPVGVVNAGTFDHAGERFAFSINSATSPSDIHVLTMADLSLERWTTSEVGGLDPAGFVAPRVVRFPTFDSEQGGPAAISSLLYEPAGPGPHPVIIVMHGGPEGQSRPQFTSLFQYWVNELGFAVALPNVRGSTGYGRTFVGLDNGFKREDSVRDIGALLDWMETQPQLDSSRVAVYGGSYGGYMVYATLMHYGDRLAGGVSNVGISHFVTFLESTADYRRDLRRVEYGDERDPAMRAHLEAISPLTNVSRLQRPMLIGQGANDPRVPRGEAEQIVAAMRTQGVPVSYFLAMNEGHGFAKKSNSDAWRAATTDFLVRLLQEKE